MLLAHSVSHAVCFAFVTVRTVPKYGDWYVHCVGSARLGSSIDLKLLPGLHVYVVTVVRADHNLAGQSSVELCCRQPSTFWNTRRFREGSRHRPVI